MADRIDGIIKRVDAIEEKMAGEADMGEDTAESIEHLTIMDVDRRIQSIAPGLVAAVVKEALSETLEEYGFLTKEAVDARVKEAISSAGFLERGSIVSLIEDRIKPVKTTKPVKPKKKATKL